MVSDTWSEFVPRKVVVIHVLPMVDVSSSSSCLHHHHHLRQFRYCLLLLVAAAVKSQYHRTSDALPYETTVFLARWILPQQK